MSSADNLCNLIRIQTVDSLMDHLTTKKYEKFSSRQRVKSYEISTKIACAAPCLASDCMVNVLK